MIFSQWMYLRGLLVLESTDDMIMFHGTTQNGAENIMHHGLRNRSSFDISNMAGEFWATTNHEYASIMSLVGEYDPPTVDNPPVVMKFALPLSVFSILRKGKHYVTHGQGAIEFRAPSFQILNQAVAQSGGWSIAPLTPDVEKKWKVQSVSGTTGYSTPQPTVGVQR